MDLEALIGEIATRHGVAVSRDDPVMILATLNERLIEESREAQRQLLEEFRIEMAGASQRWSQESQQRAQSLLQQAGELNRAAAAASVQQHRTAVTAAVRKELGAVQTAVRQLRGLLLLQLGVSLLTLFMLVGFAFWLFPHGG
ncbi:hypothetical protein [Methylotetracoccus oryzae]|uniref:hypothetical protein n=1 Tax=Methylotetracoccus oryzae TaxID=1919059 RepID=UPI0011189ED3|nr:hypothetical protein [Methylotetracoccus oryzae]